LGGGHNFKNEEHKTFIFISGSLCFTVLDRNTEPQLLALPSFVPGMVALPPNIDLVCCKHSTQ